MPEIAEVRVVANTLKRQILNRKIEKVNVFYPTMIVGDASEFVKSIEGTSISDIKTYGKWLMFDLINGKTILSHLRMEGKYFYVPKDDGINKHIHVIFTLDNGMDLRYQDVRKFGRMQLVDTDRINDTECIKKLGLEPEDRRLTSEYLLNKLSNKNIAIKEALLDQSIINGLGNIYANEVLFEAGINPFREAKSINESEANAIINASRRIVTRSFELGGTTIRSYTSSLGVIGHYQGELKVQSREGEKCYKCGEKIVRDKIGGRSTFYCKKCQK